MATEILHENNGYEKSCENKCAMNYSIVTSKTGTTRTTSSSPSTTPMTTLTYCTCTSTDAWRTLSLHAPLFTVFVHDDTRLPHGSSLERFHHTHLHGHPWRILLDSTSPFSSTSSSCLSPSSSSTSSCPLSASTRSAWQTTCAASLQKKVRTP